MRLRKDAIHDNWETEIHLTNAYFSLTMELVKLLYLLVSTRAVIGQFSGPYSPVRPAKI